MVLASTAAGRVLVAQFGHDPLELCFFLSFFSIGSWLGIYRYGSQTNFRRHLPRATPIGTRQVCCRLQYGAPRWRCS
jgi:hypothetical protein